jgi:predicted 3-demethylubiquinone-9 3-methyltransferase (glyoxalase superfamily)
VQKITSFLWFNDQAEEAMKFYTKVFKNSRIKSITLYGDAARPKGSSFLLEGQEFVALNGGLVFKLYACNIICSELQDAGRDRLALGEALRGWGKNGMRLAQVKYGVSWQIVPDILSKLLTGPDTLKTNRVMQTILKIKKLNIAGLIMAYGKK